MFEISRLTVEHLRSGCVTDKASPRFGFAVRSDRAGAKLVAAQLKVGDWETALGGRGTERHRLCRSGAQAVYYLLGEADGNG